MTTDFRIKNVNKLYAIHHCNSRSTSAENNHVLHYGTVNVNPINKLAEFNL
jgi:hypothetical protein